MVEWHVTGDSSASSMGYGIVFHRICTVGAKISQKIHLDIATTTTTEEHYIIRIIVLVILQSAA